MEELIEKVDDLIKQIDHTERVKELKKANQKIQKDKQLLEDIKQYQITNNERIKEKISSNQEFREYKKKETEVNLLIMEINQRLKEINPKGRNCQ